MPRPRVSRGGAQVFPGGYSEKREGAGPRAEAGPKRQVRSSCTCDWVKLSSFGNCHGAWERKGLLRRLTEARIRSIPPSQARRVEAQKEFPDASERQWGCPQVMPPSFLLSFPAFPPFPEGHPAVLPGEDPPPYSPLTSPDSGSAPMITCRVCQSLINVEGKMHQHVVKCGVCNEATVSYTYL